MATGSTPCAHTEWRHCRPATPAYTRAQDTSWAAAVAAKLGGRVAFQAQIAGKEGDGCAHAAHEQGGRASTGAASRRNR